MDREQVAIDRGSSEQSLAREPSPGWGPAVTPREPGHQIEPSPRPTLRPEGPGSSTPGATAGEADAAPALARADADALDDRDPLSLPQTKPTDLSGLDNQTLTTCVRMCQGRRPQILSTLRTASTNAWTRARSLIPGADSTPLATSTIQGWTRATRSATFSGVRPPARIRQG